MKLYYSPGACSLSPHIVAREAGSPVELSRVTFDGSVRTTAEGENFFEVNPRGGYVPTLRLDDGSVLIEGPAIIHYLADQAPEKKLLPERGSRAYYDALSWVAFVNSEIHKGYGPLFGKPEPDVRARVEEKLNKRYEVVEKAFAGKEYLLGEFSIADAYLYTILRWSHRANIDFSKYPNLSSFMERMKARPMVAQALAEEGLE